MMGCDNNGIEGFPLRMLIILIVIIMSLPLVYSWFKVYDYNSTESNIESEFKKLSNSIRMLYFNGNGRTRVDMDLGSGIFARLDYAVLGDGVYHNIMTYKITEGNKKHVLLEDPYIPIGNLTKNNGETFLLPLRLSSGSYTLILECRNDVDCDGDGIGDIYINISIGGG